MPNVRKDVPTRHGNPRGELTHLAPLKKRLAVSTLRAASHGNAVLVLELTDLLLRLLGASFLAN